jgi:hypothetical protein
MEEVLTPNPSELHPSASGLVDWFAVPNAPYESVKYIGKINMGKTMKSFDDAWNKHLGQYVDGCEWGLVLRRDQVEDLILELRIALQKGE